MRTTALIKRICQEMFRDKRTLALLFIAPLLILSLMYFLFNGESETPIVGVQDVNEQLISVLEEASITVVNYEGVTNTIDIILNDELDGFLYIENGKFELTLENSEPTKALAIQMIVNQALSSQIFYELSERIGIEIAFPKENSIQVNYVYGSSSTNFFDLLSPILIGFFVFFFVFLISGIGLLKERTSGTLERLLSTPIRRFEIVTAYLVGFGIFAIIQTIIVVLYSINVLNIELVGSIWNAFLINLLLALVALSLGTLLSTFAASEFQMVQFIPIAVIPQIFFSGIIPLEGMPNWLQFLSKIMPLYYGADALTAVMYKGYNLSDISMNLYALLAFAFLFITLNIFSLKKYRKL